MKKILATFFIIITIILGTILYWQHDNITALIYGIKNAPDDIAKKIDDNRETLKLKIQNYTKNTVSDITVEDEQKLFKGEISVEEISEKYNLPINIMTDEAVNNKNSETVKDYRDSSEAADKAVSDGVSKMYALKAKYVSKLGELERKVIEQYSVLPAKQQNKDTKYAIIMENLQHIADLEKKCDNEVAEVLTILESELSALDADEEIIQILQDAYENEKELKKSYYLSLYKK